MHVAGALGPGQEYVHSANSLPVHTVTTARARNSVLHGRHILWLLITYTTIFISEIEVDNTLLKVSTVWLGRLSYLLLSCIAHHIYLYTLSVAT